MTQPVAPPSSLTPELAVPLTEAGRIRPASAFQLPPRPRPNPLRYLSLFRDPADRFARLARRLGDPFTLAGPLGTVVVTGRAEGVRALLSADPATFAVANTDQLIPLVGEHTLLVQDGGPHLRDRKILTPPFHGARMRAYGRAMREIALRHSAAWQPSRPFRMLDTMQAIALDVIIRTVFGVEDSGRARRFHEGGVELVRALHPAIILFRGLRRDFGGFGPWARFRRVQTRLHRLFQGEIDARRRQPPGEDILSLLLSARFADGEAPTDEWVRDQLATMLFAGHETTAVTLAWAFDHLHRAPPVLARLRSEIADLGADPEPDAVAAAPYLSAVCQETLRLHPGVSTLPARLLLRPLELCGYTLPPGVSVTAVASLLHQDPEVYPAPERFMPDRFLGWAPSPYQYIPFGGGSRRCIGAAFALYEMKIVLASVLARCDLHVLDARPDRDRLRSFTMGPHRGVRMALRGAC